MNNEEKFQLCLAAAREIVEGYKGPCEAYAFDFGGSESDGSSAFRRVGTSSVQKEFSLPSDLAALVAQAYTNSQVAGSTSTAEKALLETLLGQSPTSVPGLSTLQEAQAVDPINFSGRSSLANIAARDPYSTNYEDAVGQMYDRMFGQGRALAQSGPMNVRGANARQGFELGEMDAKIGQEKFKDIRQQQDREAGNVSQAVQLMNTIESLRRGTALQAQGQEAAGQHSRKMESMSAAGAVNDMRRSNQGNMALAADMLGRPRQTTTENMSGRGNQATQNSNWGVGLTCCFIFLEVLNGELPPYVRKGRDEFCTPNRRMGYNWMSSWLVPLIRMSCPVRWFVNTFLVKPFLIVGRWHYEGEKTVWGPVLKPYCWGWFHLWSLIGVIYAKLLRTAVAS